MVVLRQFSRFILQQVSPYLFWILYTCLIIACSAYVPFEILLASFIFALYRDTRLTQNVICMGLWCSILMVILSYPIVWIGLAATSLVLGSLNARYIVYLGWPTVLSLVYLHFSLLPHFEAIFMTVLMLALVMLCQVAATRPVFKHMAAQYALLRHLFHYADESFACVINADYFSRLYLYEMRLLKREHAIEKILATGIQCFDVDYSLLYNRLRTASLIRLGERDKNLWLAGREELLALRNAIKLVLGTLRRTGKLQQALLRYEESIYAFESLLQHVIVVSAEKPERFSAFLHAHEQLAHYLELNLEQFT